MFLFMSIVAASQIGSAKPQLGARGQQLQLEKKSPVLGTQSSAPFADAAQDQDLDITVLENTDKRLVFEIGFPEPDTFSYLLNAKRYLAFENQAVDQPGMPGLPGFQLAIAVPRGKKPEFSVQEMEFKSFAGPAPLPSPDYKDDGLTPVYRDRYQSLGLSRYPKQSLEVINQGLLRHLKYSMFQIRPVSYGNGVYRFSKKMRITVDFVEEDDGLVPFSGYDPFDNIYKSAFLNWNGQADWKAARPMAQTDGPFAQAPVWVKVMITEPGIYEVGYQDLVDLGLSPALLQNSSAIAVFGRGGDTLNSSVDSAVISMNQVAFRMDDRGDGSFDPGDRILFYGKSCVDRRYDTGSNRFTHYENPYTDTSVYWIAIGFTGSRLIASSRDATPGPSSDIDKHTAYSRFEENLQVPGKKGIVWLGQDLQLPSGTNYIDYEFNIKCENPTNKGPDSLRICMVGYPESPNGTAYCDVYLNGQMIGSGITSPAVSRTFSFPTDNLVDGDNSVVIRLTRQDSYAHEAFLDWIEIEYTALNQHESETQLYFTQVSAGNHTIKSAGPKPVFVWDVSKPDTPVVLRNTRWDNGTLEFSDSIGPGSRIYLASFAKKPVKLGLLNLSVNLWDTDNQADYIVCGPDRLAEASRALVSWRSKHLLLWNQADSLWEYGPGTAMYIRLEDVYDQFGFGLRDPVAIRNFYYYVYNSWSGRQVSFFVNMGDGHYDYKNYTGTPGNMFPPWDNGASYSVESGQWVLEDFYFDFDGDRFQDVFYGRINARTPAEAWDYVNKIKRYERGLANGPWKNRVVFVADDEYSDGSPDHAHWTDTDAVQAHVPRSLEIKHSYGVQFPMEGNLKPQWTEDFLDDFNRGSVMLTMFVHGSPTQITHERLYLLDRDRDLINAGPRNPLVSVLSCKVGTFERLDPPHCIGEDWAINPNAALGVISTTSKATASANRSYGVAMADLLADYNPHPAGELELAGLKGGHPYYLLAGEPAVAISYPRLDITLTGPDTLIPGRSASFSGTGGSTGKVFALALDTRYQIEMYDDFGRYTQFESEDWPQFRGSLTGRSFSGSYMVPRDAKADTTGARIVVYDPGTWGSGTAGLLDSLYTSNPAGSGDITGPSISLWLDGQQLQPGDTVPLSATVQFRVSDPSGVYIRPPENPEDAASMMFIIDEETYDVSEDFQYDENSDTSGYGYFSYDFSESPGNHQLGLRAYDNVNLNSPTTYLVEVNAADQGLALSEPLPVPNPFHGGRLYFTYRVNQSCRASVALYTITGKLVWESGQRPANPGLNYISYNGPQLANGLYFAVFKVQSPGQAGDKSVQKLLITR